MTPTSTPRLTIGIPVYMVARELCLFLSYSILIRNKPSKIETASAP